MEDIISWVVTGCRLAQELESDLARLNGAPELMQKCEAISAVFAAAVDRLRALPPPPAMPGSSIVVPTEGMVVPYGGGGGRAVVAEGRGELRMPEFGVNTAGDSGGGEGTSLQQSRKRKDETGKRMVQVSAPTHGNTEIPPDDGYTWRKYGQKEILGSRFPRGYYRCTHQRLYNCPAKKQVQRLNHNPRVFQVIYRGDHTCHMSSTAPASAIPPPAAASAALQTTSLPSWFPIEMTSQPLIDLITTTTTTMTTASVSTMPFMDPNFNMYGGQVITRSGGGASTSTVDGANVVDMADAMFNAPTGGGSDSIDFIFSKWGEPSDEGKH